jgi:CDP-glycerol glycerophosphotransferase
VSLSGTPDVSVIMPVYNGADTLERALDSVVGQTLGLERVEVLLIDDGSTDESAAILDRIAEVHPSLRVIHQPNSGGPAGPRNRAIGLARGRYIFFLDQDDYLSADALEAMVRIADKNKTDIVLARIRGLGGRTTPLSMFTRTRPRTDVFESSAYWALNPLKLFRTEMIRSAGLRFAEDVPVYEDQPFVAKSYFEADGISILADKDYIFWVFRDDASNISTSRLTLAHRLVGASRMFDLLAENMPPGPKRDVWMRRHLQLELVRSAFRSYHVESDPSARDAAFARFREIAAAYYTEDIDAAFLPHGRVLMRLVSEGRQDRFSAYLDALADAPEPPELVIEGERIFLALPWFRDRAQGLPDDLFDIAPKLVASGRVERLGVGPGGVRFTAVCRLGALTERVTSVTLIARSRADARESAFPLAFEVVFGEGAPFVRVDHTIPADRLLTSPKGDVRDLYLRVAMGDTWRERRVAECAPAPKVRVVRSVGGTLGARYGLLTTTPKGNLSLCAVDERELVLYPLKRLARSAVRRVRRWFGRARG